MILAGNVALESMGFKTFGFAGGRVDIWEPEEDINWGAESKWLAASHDPDSRYSGERELANPLAAVQMGLIYVNPEGPDGNPDPVASGRDVRVTFARMAMNDEETVALVAGGHTFGKAHGAGNPALVGPEPEAAPIEQQGLGWRNAHGSGKGADTTTSGIEGAWKPHPTRWDNGYFDMLFGYEWELTKSPAGAHQWTPKNCKPEHLIPDAHDPSRRHPPMMTTADLSLRFDPAYETISRRFHQDPQAFADAFARAWFKLTHRDMGPRSRYLGKLVPREVLLWQDPVPDVDHPLVDAADIAALKAEVLASGLAIGELVRTAWASASTFRGSDKRGGANGARIRLAPQTALGGQRPGRARAHRAATLEGIQRRLQRRRCGRQAHLAGRPHRAGRRRAPWNRQRSAAGQAAEVPFTPGRTDATDAQTDAESFAVLEPRADGFRNFATAGSRAPRRRAAGGPRAVAHPDGAGDDGAGRWPARARRQRRRQPPHGVFTKRPGVLGNDFFVHLLDMGTQWQPLSRPTGRAGRARPAQRRSCAGRVPWSTWCSARMRSCVRIAEVYASADGQGRFVQDFVAAWTKVMNLDRFDVR
jgi:catalase-peroxidase